MIITYSVCAFVALLIQHSMRMRHIVIYGIPGCYNVFLHHQERYDFQEKTTRVF